MKYKIGIDVGGTFTDFLLTQENEKSEVYKVLSTPKDPSIAVIEGLKEMSEVKALSLEEFLKNVTTIVHGTTVTTNAVLTLKGAKTGLITTAGIRDALEMRRGIREEQYNNRYKNAEPVVPRYLRMTINERLNYTGNELIPLNTKEIYEACDLFETENVKSIAICFINSFANPSHEEKTKKIIKKKLPNMHISLSTEILPSIRFYDRVSTTCLDAYVSPILKKYLKSLAKKLENHKYQGILLIMQSNGGVTSPNNAKKNAATTLLSGPAGGPIAGINYGGIHDQENLITVDMGGTSFDASLIKNKESLTTNEGNINRNRIALPMLKVTTIGAGGGSIGWIDKGGLLRMGPQSAGSLPGPACYNLGGLDPTCTDADLILGYLTPDFFAGGKIPLSKEKAKDSIKKNIAKPLNLSTMEAAAGMYHVINVNMAAAVREVSIKEGVDPRDFPLIVAGGAGPNHACMIAYELEIPLIIIPRDSSIFCATGMLLSNLQHDFIQTYSSPLMNINIKYFKEMIDEMRSEGFNLLKKEGIPKEKILTKYSLDLRYSKQYHEVTVNVDKEKIEKVDLSAISTSFHPIHNQLYGYELSDEKTPIELINIRVQTIGITNKPSLDKGKYSKTDISTIKKGSRPVFLPTINEYKKIPVYDGSLLKYGMRTKGPAIIEQTNTSTFISFEYNMVVDQYNSIVLYSPNIEEKILERIIP